MSEKKMNFKKMLIEAESPYSADDIRLKNVKLKIPSFTITTDMRVSQLTEKGAFTSMSTGKTKLQVDVRLDTFKNNIEEVLDKVVSKVIVDYLNSKNITIKKVSDKQIYIGEHGSAFPKGFWLAFK